MQNRKGAGEKKKERAEAKLPKKGGGGESVYDVSINFALPRIIII